MFRLTTTGGPPGVVVDAIVLFTSNDRRLPFVARITWGAHRSVFFRADFTLVVKCGLEFNQSVSQIIWLWMRITCLFGQAKTSVTGVCLPLCRGLYCPLP